MYAKRITAGAALAAAASIVTAGVAFAGPTPTGNYQMCGYVYSNSAESTVRDMHNPDSALTADPSPSNGATMRSDYKVTGTLSGLGTTYTATSDANGGFCLQGDAVMASAVGLGATVSITAVKGPGPTYPSVSYKVFHTSIDNSTFNAHMTSGGLSATGFHVKI